MNNKQITIKYDGKYPCLCSGHLEVWIDGQYYDFGRYVLNSGGEVSSNGDTRKGKWSFSSYNDFPKEFPIELANELLEVINNEIPWGCCGGCL